MANDTLGLVVRGFAWETASRFLGQVVAWGSTVVVARLLAPEHYGLIAITAIVTGFMEMVVDMGLSHGLTQKRTVTEQEQNGIFYFSIGLGVILYLVAFVTAPMLASFFENPALTELIRWYALAVLFISVRAVPNAILMRELRFKYRAVVMLASQWVAAITALALAVSGAGVWTLVVTYLVTEGLITLGYLPLFKRIPSPRFRLHQITEVLSFGSKILVARLLYFTYSRLPTAIGAKLLGTGPIGFFTLAASFSSIPTDKIGTIFNSIAFPTVARLKDDPAACRTYYLRMHKYLLLIAGPVLLGLNLIAGDAIRLLLTEKWAPAIPIMHALLTTNMLRVSGMLMSPVLMGLGRVGLLLRYNLASAVLLPAAAFMGAHYSVVVMAWALFIAYLPLYLYVCGSVNNALNVSWKEFFASVRDVIRSLLLMGIAVAAVNGLTADWDHAWRLASSIISGATTFFLTAWYGSQQLREDSAIALRLILQPADQVTAEIAGENAETS